VAERHTVANPEPVAERMAEPVAFDLADSAPKPESAAFSITVAFSIAMANARRQLMRSERLAFRARSPLEWHDWPDE
jgi:hypothetical protein